MRVVVSVVSLLVATTLVSAGKLHTPHPTAEILPSKYIIQYEDHILHSDFVTALEASGIHHQVDHEYPLLHGASIKVHSDHEAEAIAALDGVKNLWPVTMHTRRVPSPASHIDHELHSKRAYDPISDSLHSSTGVDILQKQYQLTGKGIKVGIVDSGVDYTHPAFAMPGAKAGCLGEGCRFVAGYDFLGDHDIQVIEDADPIDHCEGHGTHVAGIVGANALHIESGPLPPQPFVGVAPEVTFGVYRVLNCDGGGPIDAALAGIQRAYDDGMDIINLSASSGSDYKLNPTAILGDKLVSLGVSFVVSGGNDGSDGMNMVSDFSLGDLSTSVASFDNTYGIFEQFTYKGQQYPFVPFFDEHGNFAAPATSTIVPLLKADGSLNNGCDAAQFNQPVRGNVALYSWDLNVCDPKVAVDLGNAAGVAVHLVQLPFFTSDGSGVSPLPMAGITADSAQSILAVYNADPLTEVTWRTGNITLKVSEEAHESVFSSYGLDGELRSKPDISAPGGQILSTYPLALGSYRIASGTSMSAPYISGVHALLMQARRATRATLRGGEIRRILKNTATIGHSVDGQSIASVAKQGAGLVNALNAVLVTTSIAPDHIDLLDSVRFQKSAQIVLTHAGPQTETFTLTHVPADSLASFAMGATFPLSNPVVGTHHATVVFSQPTVRIVAGRSVRVTLQFQEPSTGDLSEYPIYSGFIVATPLSVGGIPVHVPYTGMKGDASRMPILDTDHQFPQMVYVGANEVESPIPSSYIYNLRNQGQDLLPLVFNFRLGSHTPDFQIRVIDPQTQELYGFVVDEDLKLAKVPMGRTTNTRPGGELIVESFRWTKGFVATEAVNQKAVEVKVLRSGVYGIVMAAQRKFTEGVYPRDYEVYEMGTIEVLSDALPSSSSSSLASAQAASA